MSVRYYLSVALLGCLLLATPAQSQVLHKDVDVELSRHPERVKQLVAVSPYFNLTIEELIAQRGPDTRATQMIAKNAAPDYFVLIEQISKVWDAAANGGLGDWVDEDRVSYETDDIGVPTVFLIETWDPGTGEWVGSFRRVTIRDKDNNTVENLDQEWDPAANSGQGDWAPLQRSFLTLNSKGRPLVSTTEFWDEDMVAYEVFFRSTYTYDSSDEILEQRLFESITSGPLGPSLLTSYTYDDQGNTVLEEVQSYDRDAGQFEDWRRTASSFDNNNKRIERLVQEWDPVGATFVGRDRRTTLYSPNSSMPTMVEEIDQEWDATAGGGSGDWVNEDRNLASASYDGSTPIETVEVDQVWDPTANAGQGDWLNEDRQTTSLANGRPVVSVSEVWDAAGKSTQGAWVNDEQNTVEYDDRDLAISSLSQTWGGADWINQFLLVMAYREFESPTAVDADGVASGYQLDANYPNPFGDVTTIDFTLPEPSHVRLEVFDMLGRSVVTLVDARMAPGAHSFALDAASWPGGLYVYRLDGDRFQASQTMLLVK